MSMSNKPRASATREWGGDQAMWTTSDWANKYSTAISGQVYQFVTKGSSDSGEYSRREHFKMLNSCTPRL